MTQDQWLKSANPEAMFRHLRARASDRKLRLFMCACCRRAWAFAKDERLKEILPLIEGFADGTVKDRERGRAHRIGGEVLQTASSPASCLGAQLWNAARKNLDRTDYDFGESAAAAFGWAAGNGPVFFAAKEAESAQQAALVRDIFGNPFRKAKFNKKWRTDTVLAIARRAYDAHEFGALPILADALQDAGCDSEDLLNHLRDTSAAHVRGCWALDLVLGNVTR
jgi:hypothetical protein